MNRNPFPAVPGFLTSLTAAFLILAGPAAPAVAQESASSFPEEKELLRLYEAVRDAEHHTSRLDFSVGGTSVLIPRESSPDLYTTLYGTMLLRPFTAKPYLGSEILTSHALYRETARLTGTALSAQAEEEMAAAARKVTHYRSRPPWKRLVLTVGMLPPWLILSHRSRIVSRTFGLPWAWAMKPAPTFSSPPGPP